MNWRVVTLLSAMVITGALHAQVIQAQHGTLVLQNGRASIGLSVPVSAFSGWDNDGNRILSPAEFVTHRDAFSAEIVRKLRLRDTAGSRRLQDITLTAAAPDHAPPQSMTQLLITGYFDLTESTGPLRLTVDLYGITEDEKRLRIDVSEPGSNSRFWLVFTPDIQTVELPQQGD